MMKITKKLLALSFVFVLALLLFACAERFDVTEKVFSQEDSNGIWGLSVIFHEDGSCNYYEGGASSYIPSATWSQEGDIITITETSEPRVGRVNRFRLEGGALCYIDGESDNFMYLKLEEGQRLILNAENPTMVFIPKAK